MTGVGFGHSFSRLITLARVSEPYFSVMSEIGKPLWISKMPIFSYGRKVVVMMALSIVMIAGFLMVYPVYWPLYAFYRAMAGVAHPGTDELGCF